MKPGQIISMGDVAQGCVVAVTDMDGYRWEAVAQEADKFIVWWYSEAGDLIDESTITRSDIAKLPATSGERIAVLLAAQSWHLMHSGIFERIADSARDRCFQWLDPKEPVIACMRCVNVACKRNPDHKV